MNKRSLGSSVIFKTIKGLETRWSRRQGCRRSPAGCGRVCLDPDPVAHTRIPFQAGDWCLWSIPSLRRRLSERHVCLPAAWLWAHCCLFWALLFSFFKKLGLGTRAEEMRECVWSLPTLTSLCSILETFHVLALFTALKEIGGK